MIFKYWGLKKLREIAIYLKVKTFLKGSCLWKKGEKVDFLYFVKQGEFEVVENLRYTMNGAEIVSNTKMKLVLYG